MVVDLPCWALVSASKMEIATVRLSKSFIAQRPRLKEHRDLRELKVNSLRPKFMSLALSQRSLGRAIANAR